MQALFALALRRYFVVPMLPELPLVLLELSWLLDPLPEPELEPVLEFPAFSAFENSSFDSLPSWFVSSLVNSRLDSLLAPALELGLLLDPALLEPELELGLLALGLVAPELEDDLSPPA